MYHTERGVTILKTEGAHDFHWSIKVTETDIVTNKNVLIKPINYTTLKVFVITSRGGSNKSPNNPSFQLTKGLTKNITLSVFVLVIMNNPSARKLLCQFFLSI